MSTKLLEILEQQLQDNNNQEQRLMIFGSTDLDAVSDEGVAKIIFDSHNDENIGKIAKFKFLKLNSQQTQALQEEYERERGGNKAE